MKTKLGLTLTAFITAIILAACNTAAGELSIKDVWARPTSAQTQPTPTAAMGDSMTNTNSMGSMVTGPVSAAYMVIENKTNVADKLIGVSATVADMAQIHETVQMSDGMMGMQHMQGGLDIPAQGTVALKPGGYHIMIMGLHQNLVAGQSFSMTLSFQSGKQITVNVPVKQGN